ncbi:alpha-D-ribose 1-methylphosphonate 5-triphosphate diphosphatase [Rhodobacterales bacterium HKCCE2091]|nr:alpha-D-ribose 1-methylphosphonate 5-triphosphate diphosphatase [Rhodobacterales bacterium HKCCE2091]
MTEDVTLANTRLVLPDRVATGRITLSGGWIAEIAEDGAVPPGAVDCGGDFVTPGLIELHTDNLERHINPRPHVDWPHDAAILAHDAELAGTGITTVFDAMRIGSIPNGRARYAKYARGLASEMLSLRARGALRISHFLHLRAEVCSETLEAEMAEFGPEDRVGLVSLMDHTPGQRQYRDVSKLKDYHMARGSMSEAEFELYVEDLKALRDAHGDRHEAATVAFAASCGAVLASHDDTTAGQVAVSRDYGVRLAEFPTTEEAAAACRAAGIAVMMGAPNLVRGGSHSGNVAAEALARAGLLDIVSSDYVPSALLYSALHLARVWDDLPRAIATVTAAPAAAAGLSDRGRLETGLRADVIRFADTGGAPRLSGVWSHGARVA